MIAPNQKFVLGHGHHHDVIATVKASDPDPLDKLDNWQIKGGSGAYKFSIDSDSGEIRVADRDDIDLDEGSSYYLIVMVSDGKLPSHDQTVTITIPEKHDKDHDDRD